MLASLITGQGGMRKEDLPGSPVSGCIGLAGKTSPLAIVMIHSSSHYHGRGRAEEGVRCRQMSSPTQWRILESAPTS